MTRLLEVVSRRRGLILGVLLVAWAAAVALSVRAASSEIDVTSARIEAVEAELRAGDLLGARASLVEVSAGAARASSRLNGLHLLPLRLLPVTGPNLRAADVLSDAAQDASDAAIDVVDTLEALTAVAPGEAIELPLARTDALAPALRRLADTLAVGVERVRGTAAGTLHERIDGPRRAFLALAEPQLQRAGAATDLAEQLPVFLGRDGERTYLVGAASLSELRGSGGLIGSVSLMTADAGRVTFEEFVGIDDVERSLSDPDVRSPSAEHAQRYRRFGGLRFWRNANLSADFAATASTLLELWAADGRPPLDGVIVADSVTFERLVQTAGSVQIPGVGPLRGDDARRFIGVDAYAAFDDQDERKRVLGGVAAAAFDEAAQLLRGGDVLTTLGVLGELTSGGNLLIATRDRPVQEALARAGVAGELEPRVGEFAGIVVNNVAGNKVDFFTSRRTVHHVKLDRQGASASTVEATFTNGAPRTGLPAYVIGPNAPELDAGDNLSLVTLLCGQECQVVGAPDDAVSWGPEAGHGASDVRLQVPAGSERTVRFETRTPSAWRVDEAGHVVLTVRHLHQATITEDELRIVVAIPDGYEVAERPAGSRIEDHEVVWDVVDPRRSTTLHYRFRPAGGG